MTLRILIIQTFYPEFLADIYAEQPNLAKQAYEDQCARLFGSMFSTSDAYSHGLKQLGCEAVEIICNADAAQNRWATDHGVEVNGNIHDRRRRIVSAQVEHFDPQVIYVFEWCPLGDEFISRLRRPGRLIVGEIASPLPANRTFRGYDVMISSLPPIVEHFRQQGLPSEHLRLGFDARILDRLGLGPPRYPVTFVGGFAPSHSDRIPWLEELLREVDVDIFCYGLEHTTASSPIRSHFRGQAWGRGMYEALQQSRITLNRHACIEVDGRANTEWCNNMRLYEATGVGTCLLTEWRPHLRDLFEPDREVATYRSTQECVEKIRYLLEHEGERAEIAAAGQRRTLRDHCYTDRMKELLDLFRGTMGASRNVGRSLRRPSPPQAA